jgi:hypothetical protein
VCACHDNTPPPALVVSFGGDGGTITGTVVVSLGATSSAAGLRFFVHSLSGIYPAFAFLAELPGPSLQAITYDDTNALSASTTVQEAATGGVLWVQAFPPATDAGSFTLELSDAGPVESTDAGLAWPSPQGNLYGALVPTGDVTDAGISYNLIF